MFRRPFFATVLAGMLLAYVDARSVDAIPAFARQYDMQCNACHTRPPRLNRFGEQFHMMGFQIPSAAQPGGIVTNVREDGGQDADRQPCPSSRGRALRVQCVSSRDRDEVRST